MADSVPILRDREVEREREREIQSTSLPVVSLWSCDGFSSINFSPKVKIDGVNVKKEGERERERERERGNGKLMPFKKTAHSEGETKRRKNNIKH